jgi:hypothetical protein
MRAAIDRRLRVWAKSVGPSCPSQTQHFDKTPEAESDHDEHQEVRRIGIAKPVPHEARRMLATTNKNIVMNEKSVANKMDAANHNLAR